MVRMMRALKQEVPEEKRVLEINASHPLVLKLKEMKDAELDNAVSLLYDTALIAEGSAVPDGANFAAKIADLMMK
jgi:molecular chaperone HtpG